jgi:hypothetical protein
MAGKCHAILDIRYRQSQSTWIGHEWWFAHSARRHDKIAAEIDKEAYQWVEVGWTPRFGRPGLMWAGSSLS